MRCRTAALGGHRDRCAGCGHTTRISYNSCRNRHCPRCQGNARRRWLREREGELLPHAMSTRSLLCRANWLRSPCRTSGSSTTCSFTRALRHCLKSLAIHGILAAEIGFFSVLHSWNQRLQFHPHIHCVLAAGGLARTTHDGYLPGGPSSCPLACSAVSSAASSSPGSATHSIVAKLHFHGELLPLDHPRAFAAWLRVLFHHDWVVYSKKPFGRTGTCAALSRRLHSSRRHLELQAGRTLRRQRYFSLERFRARQQENGS